MKPILLVALLLVLAGIPYAQQIDSVDLTRPPVPMKTSDAPILPRGCEKVTEGGIADGWAEAEDHRPREITVEMVSVKDFKPALGSEVEAVVRLQNRDTDTIKIPWSTDPNVARDGQQADRIQWEGGSFEFELRTQVSEHDLRLVKLESLTGWLHSSKLVKGSELVLQPGQSINAIVKFKLTGLYPSDSADLGPGEWQLTAKWIQVGRSLSIKDCQRWNGFYYYDRFYKEKIIPLKIDVTAAGKNAGSSQ
jgi:hypothetical protein